MKTGGNIEVTLPLEKLVIAPLGKSGELLASIRKGVRGAISLSLSAPDRDYSMCGFLWKVSESLLSGAWKRRWFVLLNGQLQYYNSELALDQPKNVVICKNVLSVSEETHKGRKCIKITYKSDNTENYWLLGWDENESKAVKDMWLRKLYRCCSALNDPNLSSLGMKINKLSSKSSDTEISPVRVQPRVPVSKRMSIFK